MHRTITNFTQDGLEIRDVTAQGAELEVPPGETVEDRYDLPDYERRITMPEQIERLCQHLTKLMHAYGRSEKTMVFCVDQEHTLKVTEQMNRLNEDLDVSDYCVRIVSEEGATGKALLEKFQNVESSTPVIATTVDLLTVGVDAPSVRNIVFMKPLASIVLFKQIVGRGSRLCPDTEKFWFRIIDYTNATRLFDEWDKPSPPPEGGPCTSEPYACVVGGNVIDDESNQPIDGARVILQVSQNEMFEQRTGSDGQFFFAGIGLGQVVLAASAKDYKRVQRTLKTSPDKPVSMEIKLKKIQTGSGRQKIKITKLDVQFVDETYEERDAEGNLVTPEDYLEKVKQEIVTACHSMIELQTAWIDPSRREGLMETLEERMVHIDILREILNLPDADSFDLLAHVAFGEDIHSREERANALFNLHKTFFESFDRQARNVLMTLIEKYRYGGLAEMTDPAIFRLAPFNSDVAAVAKSFGGIEQLRIALDELIRLIYITEAA